MNQQQQRKPIRTMVQSTANTITTLTGTMQESALAVHDVVLITRIHLNTAKLEAELESIDDLAELFNWNTEAVATRKQAIEAKYYGEAQTVTE